MRIICAECIVRIMKNYVICFWVGTVTPLRKGVLPMQYVTYQDLIQIGILIVAAIGLFHEINKK